MTEDSMALVELVEKYADGDLSRELGQCTLQWLMELEAKVDIGAGLHERSEDRRTQRNRYRERKLETRLETLNLRIPKLPGRGYFPSFLEPRNTSSQANRS